MASCLTIIRLPNFIRRAKRRHNRQIQQASTALTPTSNAPSEWEHSIIAQLPAHPTIAAQLIPALPARVLELMFHDILPSSYRVPTLVQYCQRGMYFTGCRRCLLLTSHRFPSARQSLLCMLTVRAAPN